MYLHFSFSLLEWTNIMESRCRSTFSHEVGNSMSVYGRYFVLENCKPSNVFKSYVTQFDLACDRLAFLQLTFLNANYPDHITHNFILYLVSIVAWPICCSFCCTDSIFYSLFFFLWESALYYKRRDAGFDLFYLILKHFKDNNPKRSIYVMFYIDSSVIRYTFWPNNTVAAFLYV